MASTGKPRPAVAVYLEEGAKRVFACAVDWPGWCRSGRSADAALEALGTYADRYAEVTERAGVRFARRVPGGFAVVERVPGNATTDFGAPGVPARVDEQPLTWVAAARVSRLVAASWLVFDDVAAAAPAQLRKGPRGGGRDRDPMVEHVLGAETAYARKIGVRHRQPGLHDDDAVAALRAEIVSVIEASRGGPPEQARGWPVRYAARRIAWHVLDHAWEMQDRSEPDATTP
jgi:hypothetical protein